MRFRTRMPVYSSTPARPWGGVYPLRDPARGLAMLGLLDPDQMALRVGKLGDAAKRLVADGVDLDAALFEAPHDRVDVRYVELEQHGGAGRVRRRRPRVKRDRGP